MDVFVTVAMLALVYWAVALAAVSFAKAFVSLLSQLDVSRLRQKEAHWREWIKGLKAGAKDRKGHLNEAGYSALTKKTLSVLHYFFPPNTNRSG